MATYKLDSNNIFIGFSRRSETIVNLHEYTTLNSAIVTSSTYKYLQLVGVNEKYDALEIFGTVISGSAFKKLAAVLYQSGLTVNREGLLMLYVADVSAIRQSLGTIAYRLNDLFDWSEYGVKPTITTVWNRHVLPSNATIINYQDQNTFLEQLQDDFKKREGENEKLKHELLICKQQSQAKDDDLIKLRSDLSLTESALESAKIELESSKAEVATLQAKLNNCCDKLKAALSNADNSCGRGSACVDHLGILLCRQRPVLSSKFSISPCPLNISPQFGVSGDSLRVFTAVDEDVVGIFPTNVSIYATDGCFDSNHWWFVRATENNQRVMIAVYGGAFDAAGSFGAVVAIPFYKKATFNAQTQFFVGLVRGIGFRFMFVY